MSIRVVVVSAHKNLRTHNIPRRQIMLSTLISTSLIIQPQFSQARSQQFNSETINYIERNATQAYALRDFQTALKNINELVTNDPTNPKWRELRAITLVDSKNFTGAIHDYDRCLELLGPTPTLDRARILSGRGLAYEGISDWVAALDDYTQALEVARTVGADPDPYILNSRGNCHASLGEWKLAREDYLQSANGFQTARRADGNGAAGSMQKRLDGAVFAFSNAALVLAQLGKEDEALAEMQSIARRAPGSADMRIALASLLWNRGEESMAETEWEYACNNITVGCAKYEDEDWVLRIRRWPPLMAERLRSFLKFSRDGSSVIGGGGGRGGVVKGFRE